jgi:hypothetical protein
MKIIIPIFIIIFLLIWFIWFTISFKTKEYKVYEEYNNMRGKVISTSESNGTYFAIVRLENGMSGNVNCGYYKYEKGDIFINDIDYHPIWGMAGYAYFITSDETYLIVTAGLLESVWIVIGLCFIGSVGYGIYKLYNGGYDKIMNSLNELKQSKYKNLELKDDSLNGALSFPENQNDGKLTIYEKE